MHALTGGPSFPGKPCVPFFPWGPYQTKVSQLTVTLSHQSEKPNCKCLTFSPGSPTNPWGPGKPCRRDGALLFLCMHLCNWDIFITFGVCFLPVPGFQGCLAVQVLQCLLGFPVSNRQWYHGKYFVIRVYCLQPSLYSLCFPLNLEPHQFLECPVRTERKTVNGIECTHMGFSFPVWVKKMVHCLLSWIF